MLNPRSIIDHDILLAQFSPLVQGLGGERAGGGGGAGGEHRPGGQLVAPRHSDPRPQDDPQHEGGQDCGGTQCVQKQDSHTVKKVIYFF